MTSCPRRFVILPYAGGSASSFRALGKILAAEGEVVAIDYPPLDERGTGADRAISQWSNHVHAVLQPIQSEIVLFGHSMGGWLLTNWPAGSRTMGAWRICSSPAVPFPVARHFRNSPARGMPPR